MKSILTKIILLILVITMIGLPSTVYGIDDIISDGDSFIDASKGEPSMIDENALKKTSDYVYNVLFIIAVVIAVAIGMIIGIQFITGSIEQKAKVKETLVPYIIGVFVVFASFTIWKIVVNIGEQISPTPETSTGYVVDKEGKMYCENCGSELSIREQQNGKCSCGKYIKDIQYKLLTFS